MTRSESPVARTGSAAVLLTALVSLAVGCSHVPRPHWPWHRKPAEPPQAVHELLITAEDGSAAAFPQFWKRNTLVVDLQSASGSGSAVLKPREHTVWPVRIAFRVRPGQFETLEVRARQRVVLPIAPAGTGPVDLELDPGVFIMKTPQMTVLWGPGSAHSSGDW